MSATTEQLKARWETKGGKRRLKGAIKAAKQGRYELAALKGLPFVDEVRTGRDLRGADLVNADLSNADLTEVHLIDADLTKANLFESDLNMAALGGAILHSAVLLSARLDGCDLKRANLKDADLRWSTLVQTELDGAVLTGAKLFGSAREEWSIKGVKCDYVYWDERGEERTPKDRDFEPGEFESIYESLPLIEYVFRNGFTPLDPLVMERVVKAIRERTPEFDIKIDSINARGLAPSIKFTIRHEEQKDAALTEIKAGYETQIRMLEGERDRFYALVSQFMTAPKSVKMISGGVVVEGDAVFNVQIRQVIHNNALDIQKAIQDAPKDTIPETIKKTALDIVGNALKDIANGQVKEAARQIVELGKDVAPIIAQTAAYGFFKSVLGM